MRKEAPPTTLTVTQTYQNISMLFYEILNTVLEIPQRYRTDSTITQILSGN